jgi:hypothetical protein
VVPATGLTTERSSPAIRFRREDLPTLGRPAMAMRISLVSSSPDFGGRELSGYRIHEVRDSESVLRRDLEKLRKPETMELHGVREASLAIDLVHRENHALTERPELRREIALFGKKPRTAVDDPADLGVAVASPPAPRPVRQQRRFGPSYLSTTSNVFPAHSTAVTLRSRVEPATASTIALREPLMRLKSVDLPTLGRPTMAT